RCRSWSKLHGQITSAPAKACVLQLKGPLEHRETQFVARCAYNIAGKPGSSKQAEAESDFIANRMPCGVKCGKTCLRPPKIYHAGSGRGWQTFKRRFRQSSGLARLRAAVERRRLLYCQYV